MRTIGSEVRRGGLVAGGWVLCGLVVVILAAAGCQQKETPTKPGQPVVGPAEMQLTLDWNSFKTSGCKQVACHWMEGSGPLQGVVPEVRRGAKVFGWHGYSDGVTLSKDKAGKEVLFECYSQGLVGPPSPVAEVWVFSTTEVDLWVEGFEKGIVSETETGQVLKRGEMNVPEPPEMVFNVNEVVEKGTASDTRQEVERPYRLSPGGHRLYLRVPAGQ